MVYADKMRNTQMYQISEDLPSSRTAQKEDVISVWLLFIASIASVVLWNLRS